jgi:hypothetical protein
MRTLLVVLLAILVLAYDVALRLSPGFYAAAHSVLGGAAFSNWWFGYVFQTVVLVMLLFGAIGADRTSGGRHGW